MTKYIPNQFQLFHAENQKQVTHRSSTFQDNLSLPIHRWFRFPAGFSALWVKELIELEKLKGKSHIFDPFVGSGTVLIESEANNVPSMGLETHPFINRIARAKLFWRSNVDEFRKFSLNTLKIAEKLKPSLKDYPNLIQKCYAPEVLSRLDRLKSAWLKVSDSSPHSELAWVALASILRECSFVGTAQWQYILPKKIKANVSDPFRAFESKVSIMASDMAFMHDNISSSEAIIYQEDARNSPSIPDNWADLVITSPPYANNYDYADATRLEMSFFGEINGWGDLQKTVRKSLIRSCTQHVAGLNGEKDALLNDRLLGPIIEELSPKIRLLESERENHGGKKPYHLMIAAYFYDMAKVWQNLRRISKKDSLACFVIGDSAPYGIYVPVDKWLGELALAAGFKNYRFEKTRDRNIKWKNRKHRVPLHEGRLWVQG